MLRMNTLKLMTGKTRMIYKVNIHCHNMDLYIHIAQQTRRSMHFSRALLNEKSTSPSFNTQTVAAQFNLSPNVLTQALTHKSYKHGKVPSNERLEYVGRRSLEFFTMEANMGKTEQQLKKALDQVFRPGYLESKFDALGLEAGVQCHLVKRIYALFFLELLTRIFFFFVIAR